MLTLHVAISFFGLAIGALVLINLCRSEAAQPMPVALLLLSTVIISATGLALPSPPGTPTPDPARILSILELVVVGLALLGRSRRGIYRVSLILAVYFNAFVAVVQ